MAQTTWIGTYLEDPDEWVILSSNIQLPHHDGLIVRRGEYVISIAYDLVDLSSVTGVGFDAVLGQHRPLLNILVVATTDDEVVVDGHAADVGRVPAQNPNRFLVNGLPNYRSSDLLYAIVVTKTTRRGTKPWLRTNGFVL